MNDINFTLVQMWIFEHFLRMGIRMSVLVLEASLSNMSLYRKTPYRYS